MLVLLPLAAATFAADLQEPVAWYRFETPDALGTDSSDTGLTANVTGAESAEGRSGRGLRLNGEGGLELADRPELQPAGGFAFEAWLRFDAIGENAAVASKADEWMVRVDPAGEGGNLSFFVYAGNSPEPRVRGPQAKADTWYHVIATWDGKFASLWVNGIEYRVQRLGGIRPTTNPLLIGRPQKWAPTGFKGVVDEVKLYHRPVTAAEILLKSYGLDAPFEGARSDADRFEFDGGAGGWQGVDATQVAVAGGALTAGLRGQGSALVQRGLSVPLQGKPYVSLRLAASAGERGRLVFVTEAGPGNADFDLLADGKLHTYVLDLTLHPQWTGTLTGLALAPSEVAAEVRLDFVRIAAAAEGPPEAKVRSLLADRVVPRAGRPEQIVARLRNAGGSQGGLAARLAVPDGVRLLDGAERPLTDFDHDAEVELTWQVQAEAPREAELKLTIAGGEAPEVTSTVPVTFGPAVDLPKADYVPEPQPATGDVLVGCHYCPLWMQGSRGSGWELIEPYPERKPALGWYDEDNPEVTDWEIEQALDHGISFFVYCWYRRNQGHPVEQFLGHAIHDGLFHARYRDRFHFTIMWENQGRGSAGVSSEQDFLENLMPWWIENYFKRPEYLKVDNKPLLFIYRPEYLVDDLGSVENVRKALNKARQMCREAGFDGLTILGEYRGVNPQPLQLMADEGLDCSFAYCWPVGGRPTDDEAIAAQQSYWRKWRELNILPEMLTVTMGWDSTPWHPSSSIWHLKPSKFEEACRRAKADMAALPEGSLGRRVVLLDNWNEFGEGHYIAPHREYGFGYLDAVRRAFTNAPEPHLDLVPEDLGLGPYDSRYKAFTARRDECRQRVVRPNLQPGLVAWWTFDEEDGSPVALDWTGRRQGGVVNDAERVPGLVGKALNCHGGSVTVPPDSFLMPVDEMTVECWVKTDLAGQSDKWLVNNVYNDGGAGFRLGLAQGRLSFAIPLTPWSHHLNASAELPLGRWVHVAGTYDGRTMRLYQDGKEVGSLERGGRIHATSVHLCLGSYDTQHRAHFTGLLDEVRVFARGLSGEEIAARAKVSR